MMTPNKNDGFQLKQQMKGIIIDFSSKMNPESMMKEGDRDISKDKRGRVRERETSRARNVYQIKTNANRDPQKTNI